MSVSCPPSSVLSIPVVSRSGSASVSGEGEKKGFFGTLKSKLSSNKTSTAASGGTAGAAATTAEPPSKADKKQAIKEREKGKSREVRKAHTLMRQRAE